MSEHLKKAKAALADARVAIGVEQTLLLAIADIQANVSIAESLEKLASCVAVDGFKPFVRTR